MPLDQDYNLHALEKAPLSEDDSLSYRKGLSQWATGVAIVAMRDNKGHRFGLTINSFASLSLNPPLVLWSLDKSAESMSAFEQKGPFNISILSDDQQELALKFASQEERFRDTPCYTGNNGAPIIENCVAFFECDHHSAIDGGDHILFIGRVQRIGHSNRKPLLFHEGMFKNLS